MQPLKPHRALQCKPGLGILLCDRPIESRYGRLVQQDVDQVSAVDFLSIAHGGPVALRKQHRNPRTRILIDKRGVLLQRLFECSEREARVDRQKSPLRIRSHQEIILLTAAVAQLVAENMQQRTGIRAMRNANGSIVARQCLKLSRLVHISVQQEQKLRLLAVPIASMKTL